MECVPVYHIKGWGKFNRHYGDFCIGADILYSTECALWKLNWFLRDFGYDMELLTQDQIDEKALVNLRGVIRTTHITLNGHTFQNLEAFAPEAEWEELSHSEAVDTQPQERR